MVLDDGPRMTKASPGSPGGRACASGQRRRPGAGGRLIFLLLVVAVWAVPNNEAAWWHDRIYDGCMLVLDDDWDWTCETRLPARGE